MYRNSEEHKARAYTALVRPTLEYAQTVWDPYHKEHIRKLKAVQNKAARFVKMIIAESPV